MAVDLGYHLNPPSPTVDNKASVLCVTAFSELFFVEYLSAHYKR